MRDRRYVDDSSHGTLGHKSRKEAPKPQWFVHQESQPTWKLWGEQKASDIVYTIYLKKVRYHRPSKSVNSDSEDEISHLEWETVKVRLVKAATLRRLVNSLACSDTGELESTYVNVFLATYRTFATTEQVLDLLLQRYRQVEDDVGYTAVQSEDHGRMEKRGEELSGDDDDNDVGPGGSGLEPEQIRATHLKALRQALAVWLDVYPSDFTSNPNCLLTLVGFLKDRCPDDGHLQTRVASLVAPDTTAGLHGKDDHDGGEDDESALPGRGRSRSAGRVVKRRTGGGAGLDDGVRCGSPGPTFGSSGAYPSFLHVPEDVFAQQLTRMDMELFIKLQPHQCLGSIWGKSKERTLVAGSVRATVDQFNAVSLRVLSTVLNDALLKPASRAKIIAKWIEIAQELRLLKNFSSLKAIISGLQSTPVYRLRKVWAAVPRDKVESFEELARLFSEDNNQHAQREVLMREGTAKVAEVTSHADRFLPRLLQRHNPASCSVNYGTIPYLGTFLTDLTMINTAIPDKLFDNLINFEKKRKEFEILAQIKLFQGAAASYKIKYDARFQKWFDNCPVLDEKNCFHISCTIEPQGPLTPSRGSSGTVGSIGSEGGSGKKKPGQHQKSDSMTSTSSSGGSHPEPAMDSLPSSVPESFGSLERKMSTSSTSSSSGPSSSTSGAVMSPPTGSSASSSDTAPSKASKDHDRSSSSTKSGSPSPYRTAEFYIIRVSIETGSSEQQGVNLYKSIMLSNSEKTKSVITSAMMKHGVEGKPEEYTLSQILPNGEMVFPPNANVYYAINTSFELNFVLRKRKSGDEDKLTVRDKPRKKLLSLVS